jgi:aminotransferase
MTQAFRTAAVLMLMLAGCFGARADPGVAQFAGAQLGMAEAALDALLQHLWIEAPHDGAQCLLHAREHARGACAGSPGSAVQDQRRSAAGLFEADFDHLFEPRGAFYCFPDIRSTGLTSEEFAQSLLKEELVACVPGDAFGPSGAGFLRCSYAQSIEHIEEALVRIKRFVERQTPVS